MKLTVTTWYEIDSDDGTETKKYRAESSFREMPKNFDIHTEKVGAIERKILNSHE